MYMTASKESELVRSRYNLYLLDATKVSKESIKEGHAGTL